VTVTEMSDADLRNFLKTHGEDPPTRGKLGPHWHELAEELAGGEPAGDYQDGTSPDDFEPEPVPEPESEPEPEITTGTVVTERRPRRPARARKPLRERLAGRQAKTAAKAKTRKKYPRISLVTLISDFWTGMGSTVARINAPVGMALQLEAHVAGITLDNAVKGRMFDPALQRVARLEEEVKTVATVVGLPALVAAAEYAETLPEPQRSMRLALIEPMLDRVLVALVRIQGEHADDIKQRLELEGPALEEAAKLKALIWQHAHPSTPAPEPETVPA
jgi:hypothetical protein